MASGASNSGIAVAGSYVFVANGANGSIGEYTINPVTGALLSSNASFLTGLTNPLSLAAAGSTLYFANGTTVGAYAFNPSTGALSSTAPTWTALETLVTGTPAIAVSGSNLFVTNGGSEVAEYTTSGTLENADVLTITQGSITGLAVTPVPEPGDGAAVLGAAALALALVRRRPVAA
jgi:MYXO-CTERM domain-containing protein